MTNPNQSDGLLPVDRDAALRFFYSGKLWTWDDLAAAFAAHRLAAQSPTEDEIERAAIAMCNAAWGPSNEGWTLAGDEQREEFRVMARAAINPPPIIPNSVPVETAGEVVTCVDGERHMTEQPIGVQTYQTDDGRWVVSDDEMWLPGSYDSDATARAAAELSDDFLHGLGRICSVDGENRAITMADLLAEKGEKP